MEVYRRSSGLVLLLGLSLLATTLQGVQGEVEAEGPSESECRPYIEKALKELEAGEAGEAAVGSSAEQGDSKEDIPTVEITDDSDHHEGDGEKDDANEDGQDSKENDISSEKKIEPEDDDASPERGDQPAIDETDSKEADKSDSKEGDDSKEVDETASKEEQDKDGDSKEDEDDNVKSTEKKDNNEEEPDSKEQTKTESDLDKNDDADDKDDSKENEPTPDSQEGDASQIDDKSEEQKGSVEEVIESLEAQIITHIPDEKDEDSKETIQAEDGQEDKESVEEQPQADEPQPENSQEDAKDDIIDNIQDDSKADEQEDSKADDQDNSKTDDQDDSEADDDTQEDTKGDSKEESKEDEVKDSKEDTAVSSEDKDDTKESNEDAKESKEAEADDDKSEEKSGESKQSEEDAKDDKDIKEDTKEESAEQTGDDKKDEDSKEAAYSKEEAALSKEDSKTDGKDDSKESKEAKSAEESGSKEKDDSGAHSEENDESDHEDGGPVEDLSLDTEIPTDLRVRDHVEQLLKLDEKSSETEALLNKISEITLKDLKKLYENAIKPLEVVYKYRDLSNRHFGDAEIFSKPLILFMGPWSGGKSSIINYLTNNEYNETSLRTGAEPSPAYFNILMYGEEPEVIDGTELAADFTFSGLQKFGQGLEERLRGVKLPSKLLQKVNIVEIPGILEVRKQVSRVFPFNDACQWFIDRGDIIFLVYDPSKLDVGPETEAILDQLKGREHQTRIVLNKADQVKPEELMRVQGALIWNISPLMSSPQPPIMYTTSLWSRPYEPWAPVRLLQAQERAFLRDLRGAVDKRIENKIASARRFAVRVRNHAKMVDCYLTTYYNHKSVFGNRKQVADAITEHPQDYHIYEGLSTLTNISRYDLPDPDVYRDFFKLNPLYEFQQLSATCTYFRGCPINRLDIAIAYDLPELLGTHKRRVESGLAGAASGPTQTSAPGS